MTVRCRRHAEIHSPATAGPAEPAWHLCVFNRIGPVEANRGLGPRVLVPMVGSYQLRSEVKIVDSRKIAVVALLCTIVALGACRREDRYYDPLKLGADVPQQDQAAR